MINEISQFMISSLIGCVYGILLDEIFILIQNRFRQNRITKCTFAILQLFVSVILLWGFDLSISSLLFTTMYYNTQYNLWNNMLAFKNNNTN
jgi:ABC-type Fe3+ transport system permease subunit